jgi:hypothetical protein
MEHYDSFPNTTSINLDSRKRKQTYVSPYENSEKLIYIKKSLKYSIGNIESNFEEKLPLIIMIIQGCIDYFNDNNNSNSTSNDTSMIKNIYKNLAPIIGRDFTRNYKKHDVHKISYCIMIITYHLYVKTFPEKLNINRHIFYELYPHFANYEKEEKKKLFNFYKCCVIFKNIIEFRRNFGFIFDSSVFIVEGFKKKYTRGGGANLETRNRSKILFEVYGEVKKPSMRHIKNIFNYDVFSNISSDENSYEEETSDEETYCQETYNEGYSDEQLSDEETYDDSLINEEYIFLKKLRIDFSLFNNT